MRQITFGEYLQEKRRFVDAVDWGGIAMIGVLGSLPFIKTSSRLENCSRDVMGGKLVACPHCGLRADEQVWVN